MTDRLHVKLFDRHVGELHIAGQVRAPEDWHFAYAEEYLRARPIPLSASLPCREEPYRGAVVRNWFGNLLPEGAVREAIATRLRIPVWDDFELLAAIGGECAGAVSMASPDGTQPFEERHSQDLQAKLSGLHEHLGQATLALMGTPHRLSLAGAQDKLAVVLAENGSVRLPAINEITTHILKPDSLHVPGLRDFEAFGLRLAKALGLNVARADIIEIAGISALLVERYDRQIDGVHGLLRMHQEDFCQALGYPSELKYETAGGPSLARCMSLIREQLRLGPRAVQAFLDWVLFNALIGNADAHAKNLALLCDREGRRRLAPFYDLVPTIAIPESLIERQPALKVGLATRVDGITPEDIRSFASACGYTPSFVVRRLATMADGAMRAASRVADELVEQGASSKRIENVLDKVRGNAQRIAQWLR